ncbi:MAG TPA: amidohydrolase family protein, partial [Actinopolymorphaceae bacterium]
MTYDLLLQGGRVADGTGEEPYAADVAVSDGRIEAIGDLGHAAAATVIDVTGRLVMPGFVDAHVHAETVLERPDVQEAMLRQGVTTVIIGQDGLSFAPGSAATVEYVTRYFAAVAG